MFCFNYLALILPKQEKYYLFSWKIQLNVTVSQLDTVISSSVQFYSSIKNNWICCLFNCKCFILFIVLWFIILLVGALSGFKRNDSSVCKQIFHLFIVEQNTCVHIAFMLIFMVTCLCQCPIFTNIRIL